MKRFVSILVVSTVVSAALVLETHAAIVEFNQLPSTNLSAPLPFASFGTAYYPIVPTYHTTQKIWGYGTPTGTIIPSVYFSADDNVGVTAYCSGKYPKHLGTDYAAPAGTQVFAIADGKVRRIGGFTGIGDSYVVVESGSTDKWTTLYGHLNAPSVGLGATITKGMLVGTLYNYRELGDIPHLHLGIRKGVYMDVPAGNVNSSTRGDMLVQRTQTIS